MSKLLGNFVGLDQLRGKIAAYGEDALRYYLLRAAPFGSDLDWSEKEFSTAYDDLSKKLGNCLNRTTNMTTRYRANAVPAAGELQEIDRAVLAQAEALPAKLADAYGRLALQECALLPVELVRTVDGFIEATAPFKLAKDPRPGRPAGHGVERDRPRHVRRPGRAAAGPAREGRRRPETVGRGFGRQDAGRAGGGGPGRRAQAGRGVGAVPAGGNEVITCRT